MNVALFFSVCRIVCDNFNQKHIYTIQKGNQKGNSRKKWGKRGHCPLVIKPFDTSSFAWKHEALPGDWRWKMCVETVFIRFFAIESIFIKRKNQLIDMNASHWCGFHWAILAVLYTVYLWLSFNSSKENSFRKFKIFKKKKVLCFLKKFTWHANTSNLKLILKRNKH